jgi:hypothetical protein
MKNIYQGKPMQLSFFDHVMQYQGGKKSMKFLSEMKELIPFEAIEKILIKEGIYKSKVGKKGGRPYAPAKILIGALFLQNWYSLSDPMTEELMHDRVDRSFRHKEKSRTLLPSGCLYELTKSATANESIRINMNLV